jgi:hypothetical protein
MYLVQRKQWIVCIVLFKHARHWWKEAAVTGKGINFGALTWLVRTVYQLSTMITKICGSLLKFVRNDYCWNSTRVSKQVRRLFWTALLAVVLNTRTWKCRMGPTVEVTSCWTLRNEEEATVEQIAAKHQKISEDREAYEDDTTERERVTNQDARKCTAGLRLHFTQDGIEGSPLYNCTRNLRWCCSLAVVKRRWQGTQNKQSGLSPRANFTDKATASCRRSWYQLLRIKGRRVVNATDPLWP